MTTPGSAYVFSGLQNGIVYELNAKGRPKATTNQAYVGLEVYASKLFNLTLPAARRVAHIGNDRLLKVQIFPSQEIPTGELNVGAEDLELVQVLKGATDIKEIAGMKMLPSLSDLEGNEPNVGMILWQAALEKRTSAQGFRFFMLPQTKAVPRIGGAGPDPIDTIFDLSPNPSEAYLWGASLAPLADPSDEFSGVPEVGAYAAGVWDGFSVYPPRIASFISDADDVAFLFPNNAKPQNVDDIAVFTADADDDFAVEVDPNDYTATLTGVTFDTTPGLNKEVHILFLQDV